MQIFLFPRKVTVDLLTNRSDIINTWTKYYET